MCCDTYNMFILVKISNYALRGYWDYASQTLSSIFRENCYTEKASIKINYYSQKLAKIVFDTRKPLGVKATLSSSHFKNPASQKDFILF